MYNFYIFILLSIILKILIISLKKDILMYLSVLEESVIVSIGLCIGFIIVYLCINSNFNNLSEKLYNSSNIIRLKLICFMILVLLAILVGGSILSKENIARFIIFKEMIYIIGILFVSVLYYKKNINIITTLGVILIICGLYLVDGDLSSN